MLDKGSVSLGLREARDVVEGFRNEKYPAQQPVLQEICILQQAEVPVWNVTLVIGTLNMLNVKVHAETGEILHDHLRNIMDLRK